MTVNIFKGNIKTDHSWTSFTILMYSMSVIKSPSKKETVEIRLLFLFQIINKIQLKFMFLL